MSGNKYYYLKSKSGLDELVQAETSIPKPARGQVLIKVHASSLNYRDLLTCKGGYPYPLDNLIPNSDGAGEIIEVGEAVTNFKKGDRVYAMFFQTWIGGEIVEKDHESALGGGRHGMLTQYKVLDDSGIVKIPDYLSYEEASTLTCSAVTAWNSLFEAPKPLIAGQTVLVLGTGGVSIHALQFAKAAGATVIATSSSDEKLQKAKALGADHLINYKKNEDWEKKVLELTDGKGVDHVVEVGGPGTLLKSAKSTRSSGHVGVIGILDNSSEQGLGFVTLRRTLIVRGIYVGSREMYQHMNKALEAHKIKPVVDKVFSFDQAVDAFKYLDSQAHVGKVVIKLH